MRYQRGQYVVLGSSLDLLPDGPPVATVLDPNNALFGQFPIPYAPVAGSPGYEFAYPLSLPGGAVLGTYQVTIAYAVAGVPASITSSFDVVAGGDSGGQVISMYAYVRPEAKYVLAQLSSGKLVQGRNPHL
jgi:hypothetical protein